MRWAELNDISLKEKRRHGDIFLPINNYHIDLYDRTLLLDCHWHEEMELFKVLKGRFRFQIASDFYQVDEGDLLFVNSGELHSAEADKNTDASYQAVVFSPQMLAAAMGEQISAKYLAPLLEGRLKVQRLFENNEISGIQMQKDFGSIFQLLSEKPIAYEILLKASLLDIFGLLVTSRAETYPKDIHIAQPVGYIKEAISYMQNHYSEKITVAMIARYCNISEGYFSRQFHHYVLNSPICYLNRLRLLYSAEMLNNTDKKILDIALDCGFCSFSYFIHVFRENMGCSPSEYRRREKN
jgi:AraC-like DNA-binding protein